MLDPSMQPVRAALVTCKRSLVMSFKETRLGTACSNMTEVVLTSPGKINNLRKIVIFWNSYRGGAQTQI